MNIVSTQYGLKNKNLEIFLSGCLGLNKCRKTCHNPDLWNFNSGNDWFEWKSKIKDKINDFDDIIDTLIITGGEPLDQDEDELIDFIIFLKQFNKPIILFTSYNFNKVSDKIKHFVDYLKCGVYDERYKGQKDVGFFTLATTNQILYRKETNTVWSCV